MLFLGQQKGYLAWKVVYVTLEKCFTISEVAAIWHELMITWHIMLPSFDRASEKWTHGCCMQTYQSSTQGFHVVACAHCAYTRRDGQAELTWVTGPCTNLAAYRAYDRESKLHLALLISSPTL